MTPIDEFVTRYSREYDYYQLVARICQQQCEIKLEQSGILAIVTSRAKRPDRLRAKVEKREKERGSAYTTPEEIAADIVDLAGVRIALYFPGNRDEIDGIINKTFSVYKAKPFPEEDAPDKTKHPNRFSGYHAMHYRVRLREELLKDADKRYSHGLVEIQVASVLMHAWAEVNHDLVYKPFSGDLSELEYAMLDQLNGLVLSGEIALESLQKAYKHRVSRLATLSHPSAPFSNHFELAAYLHNQAKHHREAGAKEQLIGRADLLFELLRAAKLDEPSKLQSVEKKIDFGTTGDPIAQQYIDVILSMQPDLYDMYATVQREVGKRNPYGGPEDDSVSGEDRALGRFVRLWGILEGTLYKISLIKHPGGATTRWSYNEIFGNAAAWDLLTADDSGELKRVYAIRNQVIHGDRLIEPQELDNASNFIQELLMKMQDKAAGDDRVEPTLQEALVRLASVVKM